MGGEVEAAVAEGLDGFPGGVEAVGGVEAGGLDGEVAVGEAVGGGVEAYGEDAGGEGGGHGGAAGIAGADEEDELVGQAVNDPFVDDAGAENAEAVVVDADEGGGITITYGAGIDQCGEAGGDGRGDGGGFVGGGELGREAAMMARGRPAAQAAERMSWVMGRSGQRRVRE